MRVSFGAILVLGIVAPASAQTPPEAVKALEDEINVVKETIESNNAAIRQLKERLSKAEAAEQGREQAIKDLREKLGRLDSLTKQLQELEAKLKEKGGPARTEDATHLKVTAEVRVRPEYSNNRTDLRSHHDSDPADKFEDGDAFWSHRVRLGADIGFDTWVRARVEVQEARKFGATIDEAGSVSLHQGWLELKPPKLRGLRLRAGRMEMSYGSERLIGRDDFTAQGRAFDGVVLRAGSLPYFDIEVFYAKLREGDVKGDRDFFGAYMYTRAIPLTTIDLYVLGLLDEVQKTEPAGVDRKEFTYETGFYTIGARADVVFSGLRIEGEVAVQVGSRSDPDGAKDPENADEIKTLKHYAVGAFADVSYQIPVFTRPTLGAFFAYASGDANPGDDKSRDFQPLFPTRHGFLGAMDLFSWSNIIDYGGKLHIDPPLGFGVTAAVHQFRLTQKCGNLFGLGGGKTIDPGTQQDKCAYNVGTEIDLALSWSPADALQIQGGYSIFLPSSVPKRRLLGSEDAEVNAAQWAYLQARVRY